MSFKRILEGGQYDFIFEDHNGNLCCPVQALKEEKAWLAKTNIGRKKKIGYVISWFTVDITEETASTITPTPDLMDYVTIEDYEAEMLAEAAGVTIEDHTI